MGKMQESNMRYIPIEKCLHNHLYHIDARNGTFGIYDENTKCFDLRRTKFGDTYIFPEDHWDACPHHGTAKPLALICEVPEFLNEQEKIDYLYQYDKMENDMEKSLGAMFIDIDGTIIDWSTEKPVKNSVETINKWKENGWQIILTTRRGKKWPEGSKYSTESTIKMLKNIGVEYDQILWDVHSPRIVINDEGAMGINHPSSGDWNYSENPFKEAGK